MKSDIEIAMEADPLHITEIADKLGLPSNVVMTYGKYKAKINHCSDFLLEKKPKAKKDPLIIISTLLIIGAIIMAAIYLSTM